mgnify:FL=1
MSFDLSSRATGRAVGIAASIATRARHVAETLLPALLPALGLALSLAAPLRAVAEDAAQGQPQRLPAITLQAGMHNIRAEVARSEEERQTGLMFRREMATHEGMLFIFDEREQRCFWMKNTPLPLSIAFIADDGTIVDLLDMRPQSLDNHCSSKPVRYALEMNQGWFARRAIKPGFRLVGAPFAKAAPK